MRTIPIKNILSFFVIFCFTIVSFSCANRSYPCPGLGQSDAADLSMFGDNGDLKPEFNKKKRARINKETGVVNKKNPKKIKKPRRNHI